MRRAVSELLLVKGIRLPPGKRRDPRLEKLVEDLTPVLLYFGVPLASGEYSKLVTVLRRLCEEFDLPGDPRDALRREIKQQREMERRAYIAVMQAAADGWAGGIKSKLGEPQSKPAPIIK